MNFKFNVIVVIRDIKLESLIPLWFFTCIILNRSFMCFPIIEHFTEWVHFTESFGISFKISLNDLDGKFT